MITTRFEWTVDREKKVLFNRYGSIQQDGPTWYFRGSYFDREWVDMLFQDSPQGSSSLQPLIEEVERRIEQHRKRIRRRFIRKAVIALTAAIAAVISVVLFLH